MARNDDLELLLGDTEHWNEQRPEHPDLSDADLSNLDLTQLDLSDADLSESDLTGSDLRGSSLFQATLDEAVLVGCDFRHGTLSFASFADADLRHANLTGIELSSAVFDSADLRHAILRKVEFNLASFEGADLSRTRLYGAEISGSFVGATLVTCFAKRATFAGADFTGADLTGASLPFTDLSGAELPGANLRDADLRECNLTLADLEGADLRGATLHECSLRYAKLADAQLQGTDLSGCDFHQADLTDVDARGADLTNAVFVESKLAGAHLTGARVYGAAAWDLDGEPTDQSDLVITKADQADITVDNLKMAQFIYLMISNAEIRDVIDTLTSKMVLILGRFSDERKEVLDAVRDQLREHNCTPVVFDFAKPASRGFGETVSLLARMSRYVIADLTDALELRAELMQIVPHSPRLPVLPILLSGHPEYATFITDVEPYPWVLPRYEYESLAHLIATLPEAIAPADAKWRELAGSA